MSRLKQLRKSHGITQDELGEILGVQKAAVCKYETGRVPLPHEAIVKLCDHFHVTADYLLGIDGPEDAPAQVTPLFKQRAAASPAWKLHGLRGFVGTESPAAVGAAYPEGHVAYHLRGGLHYLSRQDWLFYMDFVRRHKGETV